jgi:hypothetical protein
MRRILHGMGIEPAGLSAAEFASLPIQLASSLFACAESTPSELDKIYYRRTAKSLIRE